MRIRLLTLLVLVILVFTNVIPLAAQTDEQKVEVVEVTDTYRLVRHPLGETKVPLHPKRIATLIPNGGVDYLLTYGVVPVAAADLSQFGYGDSALPTYYHMVSFPVKAEASQITGISCCAGSYNLELLLKAAPDVIIGWTYQVQDIYDKLSAIAPTVAIVPYNGPDWIEAGHVMAEVLGLTDVEQTWNKTWETSIQDLKAKYGDTSKISVSIVNASNPGELYLYTSRSQPGQIAEAAGFKVVNPPNFDTLDGAGSIQISLETLQLIEADVIFVTVNFFDDKAGWETFQTQGMGASPLWKQLKAVQNERVYPVDTFFWTNGGPTVNSQLVLPDLFAAVFENKQPRNDVSNLAATPEATEATSK